MKKYATVGVLFLALCVITVTQAFASTITTSTDSSGPVSATANTAPVFDPLSTQQLVSTGGSVFLTVGITDREGDQMNLSVSGVNVVNQQVTYNQHGRLEALVELASTGFGVNTVSFTARDSQGATTNIQMPFESSNVLENNPIIFSDISHKKIKVNELNVINFYVLDEDPEPLDVSVVLPSGAVLEETQLKNGIVAGRIFWHPGQSDIGIHHIKIAANDSTAGRNNSAQATMRIEVTGQQLNTAPVFDPISTQQLVSTGGSIFVPIGITDSEGDQMNLTVNGVNVINYQVTNNLNGRLEALVELASSGSGQQMISYTVQDSQGATTTVHIPYESNNVLENNPIIFSDIAHKKIKVNELNVINFYVKDGDPEYLNAAGVFPPGAVVEITDYKQGAFAGRISWHPGTSDIGFHDIKMAVFEVVNGRKNLVQATMRVEVTGQQPNTAPVFDPISTQQLVSTGGSIFVPIGITDSEGDQMNLTVNGVNVINYQVTNNLNGRLEALVELASSGSGQQMISYTVQDSQGATTTVHIPYESNNVLENNPIIFSDIAHKKIKVNELNVINLIMRDEDPEYLQLMGVLPPGAVVEATDFGKGKIGLRVFWHPRSSDIGFHDLKLIAYEYNNGRNNLAEMTMRVEVTGQQPNTAPVFDPISTQQLVSTGGSIFVPIGITDSEGDQMNLTVNGVNVINYQVTNNLNGRLEALVELASSGSGQQMISYTVQDSQGATTTVHIPYESNNVLENNPTIIGGASHQTIKANQMYQFNLTVSDADAEYLSGLIVLPPGAVVQVPEYKPGFYSLRIYWQPSQSDIGNHDIKLYAFDAYPDRKNSALATMRLKVTQ